MANQHKSHPFSAVAREAVTAHYSTAAYVQLSLTMLLMHAYLARPARPSLPAAASLAQGDVHSAAVPGTGTSSSGGCTNAASIAGSSSGCCRGSSGAVGGRSSGCCNGSTGCSSSNGVSSSHSSNSDCCIGSNRASALPTAAGADDALTAAAAAGVYASLAHVREQQWQQLEGNVTGMWRLLRLQPNAFPAFAAAVLADDQGSSCFLNASVDYPHHASKLPTGSPPRLQARYRTMSQLAAALFTITKPASMSAQDWRAEGMPISLDALSRQQQQLLQAVCWPLPELLLRTALLCGEGELTIVGTAAAAATGVLSYWHEAGMESAAAAKTQQLPALLDCWLQLMQQLLLHAPLYSCLHAAAAAEGTLEQQLGNISDNQRQDHLPPPGLLLQVAATARLLAPGSSAAQQLLGASMCSCDKEDYPLGTSDLHQHSTRTGSISSVRLVCGSLETVGLLLGCLGAMKVRGMRIEWTGFCNCECVVMLHDG